MNQRRVKPPPPDRRPGRLHQQTRRRLWGAALALGAALLSMLLHGTGGLQRVEQITHDQRMVWSRADSVLHPSLAVVLIDEPSLQAMDPLVGRYPWPRAVYADLIEYMTLAGARAVVFDILFTETQKDGSTSDSRLAEATRASGRTIHAFQLFQDESEESEALAGTNLSADFIHKHAVTASGTDAATPTNRFVIPGPALHQAAAAMGVVDVSPDSDGVYRRLHPLHRYAERAFPALAITPLLIDMEKPWSVMPGANETLQLGAYQMPTDHSGRVFINQVADLRPYSFAGIYASIQALHNGDLGNLLIPPNEFTDKIVFVGASAVGLADIKATPLSPRVPGVTLHASLLDNLLSGEVMSLAPAWFTHLLVLVFALVTALAVMGSDRLFIQFGFPLLLAGGYSVWNIWQFTNYAVYPLAAPLFAIAATAVALWAFLAITEGRDKRQVRAMFSQYVSPAVLNQLVERPGAVLEAEIGQAERLTILFSDVRSFTSISEVLRPEQTVDLLNTHFEVMSEIIFHYEGTLDKFIGDAIMAFWGAPIIHADHAERSVKAAVAMQRGLAEVNQRLQEKGYPAIAIGIGVNTGETILGNIGSTRKLDYTVIGDTVNLASRLEGLTKLYGQGVVISEYTRAALPSSYPTALLDMVRVKGKHRPVAIHAPLALPDDPPEIVQQAEADAAAVAAAFSAYHERRWDEAVARYRQLPERFTLLSDLFIARCEAFQKRPPDAAWDGVYIMNSK